MKISQSPNLVRIPFLVFLATLLTVRAADEPVKYCTNLKCRIAGEILLSMKRSIDPCTDFFEHACGAWKEKNPINNSQTRVNHFDELTSWVEADLSKLLKNIELNDTEAVRKAKTFYDSCTDFDAIKRRGLTPIEGILIENGEWPLSVSADKWNPRNLTWQQIHENFAKRVSVSAIFDVKVEIDRRNSSVYVLSLSVPTVPSERKEFLSRFKRDTRSDAYNEYLIDAIGAIKDSRGLDAALNDVVNDLMNLFRLEASLDTLDIMPEGDKDTDDFIMTSIETLQRDWNTAVSNNPIYAVDWLKIINGRFDGTGIVVGLSDQIVLQNETFVTDIARILVRTSVRTIVNYIHWKAIDVMLPLTSSRIRNPKVQTSYASNRSELCVSLHKMNHAISYMYVRKYSNPDSKIATLEMIKGIRDEIKREIMNCSWLDDATKLLAQEKADAMTNFVAYPEWYDEPGKITEYYNELTVGHNYFENVIASNVFEAKKRLSRLRRPVSKIDVEWIAQPHIVNAEYNQETNSLILNYGALGAMIGHEVAHGFDNSGRLRDKNGNKRKWLAKSAMDSYNIKAQCFIDQFNNYTLYKASSNNITVYANGKKTLGENIADTTGFRAALKAYQTAKNNGKTNNVKIRLLKDFTDEQLYFYGLANTLCESVSIRGLAFYSTNEHSPGRLRITGVLSNMQEFADAFSCPVGSPMNPSKKCLLWD